MILKNLRRLDNAGVLYHADFCTNWRSPLIRFPVKLMGVVKKGGCSAFCVKDENGHILYGRNYDLPHKDSEGQLTGLNIVINCAPKKGYKSVAVADACWLSIFNKGYRAFGFDNKKLSRSILMALLPYLCMDGMNEKGLCVSVLALDLKKGETPVSQCEKTKPSTIVTMLLRDMLDSCANLDEALSLAASFNLKNTFGMDYHLFVSDHIGKCAVLEWRYNTLTVTCTDAVTNFYVGYEDAEDCWYTGGLKEKFVKPSLERPGRKYGYGHGYGRFATLSEALYNAGDADGISLATMNEDQSHRLLVDVAQDYDGSLTSMTQYSSVYDSTSLTLTVETHKERGTIHHFTT